jgi:hypothetical protein
MESKK